MDEPEDPPMDDAAARWEDDYCEACRHHNRYHFESSDGKVYCRWDGQCPCAEISKP